MTESSLVEAARRWVVETYPYNRDHLVCALDWLDRLAPGSQEAVRLATLTHDMERAFPGPDSPEMQSLNDPVYIRLHSERSARIVGTWLRDNGASEALVHNVETLILAHETCGWLEADLVQAADSLFSAADVRWKFEHSYQRIRVPHAKALALPRFEEAGARLATLENEELRTKN
jgi:hypothetical protein